ncbi:mitochondrial Homoaconitase [Rhizina undulata]
MSLRAPLYRLSALRQIKHPAPFSVGIYPPPARSLSLKRSPITRIDPPPPKFSLRTSILKKAVFKPEAERKPPGPISYIIFVTTGVLLAGYIIHLSTRDNGPKALTPETFVPFNLTSVTPVSTKLSKTAIFTLVPDGEIRDLKLPLETDVVSVQIMQPAIQIQRPYTPFPSPPGELRFLIKLEHGGEMSRYLFSMAPGAKIHCRGPFSTYTYPAFLRKGGEGADIAFIAGGTGIAPAIQMAQFVLSQNDRNRMKVLWAVRYRDETKGEMEREVEKLNNTFGERFKMDVYVDEERKFIELKDIQGVVEGARQKKVVLVSGPDGFIGYVAGEKEWRGGKELQGKVGGLLHKVLGGRNESVDVWKL